MARASIHIKRTRTVTRRKVKANKNSLGSGTGKKGNQNRCPSCGRYL